MQIHSVFLMLTEQKHKCFSSLSLYLRLYSFQCLSYLLHLFLLLNPTLHSLSFCHSLIILISLSLSMYLTHHQFSLSYNSDVPRTILFFMILSLSFHYLVCNPFAHYFLLIGWPLFVLFLLFLFLNDLEHLASLIYCRLLSSTCLSINNLLLISFFIILRFLCSAYDFMYISFS